MIDIEDIRLMNYASIEYNKIKGINNEANELINNLFEDKACFFKMSKDDAIMILTRVGVSKEVIEKTYMELISFDVYKRLIDEKKLSDEEVVIKNNYKTNEVFSNKTNNKENLDSVDNLPKVRKENVFTKLLNKIKALIK